MSKFFHLFSVSVLILSHLLVPVAWAQETDSLAAVAVPLSATITAPAANAEFNVDQEIQFSAIASGGSTPYTFVWNFGDDLTPTAGQTVEQAYAAAGDKTVILTVTDFAGAQVNLSLDFKVISPSVPLNASITSPATGASFNSNQSITFSATASGGSTPYTFVWNFGDGLTPAAGQTVEQAYSATGTKTVMLKVTDFTNTAVEITRQIIIIDSTGTTTPPTATSTKPVISNIRVTDIGETSAIVRWTTDRAANSRVIYDTTSHPSIVGASFPNFGYANSSAAQDDAAKVTEHAVTLTGLTPNTTYFFRVLSQ